MTETAPMNSDNDEDLIANILKACFQHNPVKVLETREKKAKLHFTSKIIQLEIECYEGNKAEIKNLILKIPNVGRSNAYFSRFDFYYKEQRTYAEMIPHLSELLGTTLFPLYYGVPNSEILVLEDLLVQGYRSGEKGNFFDLHHSSAILQALAQFHAASYKIHQQNPHLLDEAAFSRTIAIDSRQDHIDPWRSIICELLRRKHASYLIPKIEKAVSFLQKDDDEIYTMVRVDHFKLLVLNHGDFRKENFLLKYNAQGRPENVKFIDFQACWWSSPAFDFLTYLIFSVQTEIVEYHFETLVDTYWKYLTKALDDLKCSYDYERTDFITDVERLHFVIVSCLLARCTFSCEFGHATMEDTMMLESAENVHPYFECLEDEKFTRSLFGWLKFAEKLGVFETFHE